MTKEETMDYISELEEKLSDSRGELLARPEKIVKEINETTISNSDMGGDIGALAEALAKCQGEFTSVVKGSKAHSYNYADIDAVLKATNQITSKYGVSISQLNVSKMIGNTPRVGVKTVIAHSAGGYMAGEIYIPTMKTKMNSLVQMAGVNITYLRRYGIQSALGLSTTDNDGSDK